MTASLRRFWTSRTPRQRRWLMAALMLLAGTLYFWLLLTATQARSRLQQRVGVLQVQALQLDRHADEFEQLQALPSVAWQPGDLQALVQARLQDGSGLNVGDARIEAEGSDRVRVELPAIAFAQWLEWVEALSSQRIQLESCQIEALESPGMVSISARLIRPSSP